MKRRSRDLCSVFYARAAAKSLTEIPLLSNLLDKLRSHRAFLRVIVPPAIFRRRGLN
jgi:hypothetical protein